jgi:hypothetical protein
LFRGFRDRFFGPIAIWRGVRTQPKDYEPTASPPNTVRHPKKRTRRVVSEMMDNSYGDDDAVSDSKSSPKDSTPL